jgi:hypothetical protein
MNLTRRGFLAAPVALGGAAAVPSAWGQDGPPARLVVLRGGIPFDDAFFAGAAAGRALLGRPAPRTIDVGLAQAAGFTRLRKEFRRLAGGCVIGLMEHGTALVVEQALLDCRAAVVCGGDHIGADGAARHRFGGRSNQAGIVSEPALDAARDDWPYALGHALAGAGMPDRDSARPRPASGVFKLTSFVAIL